MGEPTVAELERIVHGDLQPDRTYLFDLEAGEAARRRAAARAADRFEAEDLAFFSRVRDAYLRRARLEPERFVVIDGSRSPDDIRAKLKLNMTTL
jgi:dTMP kinase